jgi:hypothetical protein
VDKPQSLGVTFGRLLTALIAEKTEGKSAFARACGSTAGFINNVCRDRRLPPLDSIESWADALSLTGEPRRLFLQAAFLAHAPSQVRDLVRDLQRQVADQGHRITCLEQLARDR